MMKHDVGEWLRCWRLCPPDHVHRLNTWDEFIATISFRLSSTETWWSNSACMLKGSHILCEKPVLCALLLCKWPTDFECSIFEPFFSSLFSRFENCPVQVAFLSVKKISLESLSRYCVVGDMVPCFDFVFAFPEFLLVSALSSRISGSLTNAGFSSCSSYVKIIKRSDVNVS